MTFTTRGTVRVPTSNVASQMDLGLSSFSDFLAVPPPNKLGEEIKAH